MVGNLINESQRDKVFFIDYRAQPGEEERRAVGVAKNHDDACLRLKRMFGKQVQIIDCVESTTDTPIVSPQVVDSILAAGSWAWINQLSGKQPQPVSREDNKKEHVVPEKKLQDVFM